MNEHNPAPVCDCCTCRCGRAVLVAAQAWREATVIHTPGQEFTRGHQLERMTREIGLMRAVDALESAMIQDVAPPAAAGE